MRHFITFIGTLLLILSNQAVAAGKHEIQWFDGSVYRAFTQAKQENKPVFLYWGAKWCPPCNQLKATLFKERKFIEKTRLFVPVYLDGDTDSAQKWGEKFGVMGYPTLIVFTPEGKEITRIPGGLELERYTNVLDLTLQDTQPVAQLLKAALAGKPLTNEQFRLLAFYSWHQDKSLSEHKLSLHEMFSTLEDACPQSVGSDCSRFTALKLWELTGQKALTEQQITAAVNQIETLLDNNEMLRTNLEFATLSPRTLVPALFDNHNKQHQQLADKWLKQLSELQEDEQLSLTERLNALYGELQLSKWLKGKVPEMLRTKIQQKVAWADKAAANDYERQAAVNRLYYLMDAADMHALATQFLEKELSKSASPHYWMSDLAALAQEQGNNQEAVQWLEKAYQGASGAATRFQWGTNYVVGLIEMFPTDNATIERATSTLFTELAQQKNPVHGRNVRRLNTLAKAFSQWEAPNKQTTISHLNNQFKQLCEQHMQGEVTTCLAAFDVQ